MLQISFREWQIVSIAVVTALAAGAALWYFRRKHPTEDELEAERRESLVNFGRIVDGLLLNRFQETAAGGRVREMLVYWYEISGVRYECSQDITALSGIIEPEAVCLGMPCSIRYLPGNPGSSLVVSERWSGLRDHVPMMWIPIEQRGEERIHERIQDRAWPEPNRREAEDSLGAHPALRQDTAQVSMAN